jgi:hypothetical protein
MLTGALPFPPHPEGEDLANLGRGRLSPVMGVSEEANDLLRVRNYKRRTIKLGEIRRYVCLKNKVVLVCRSTNNILCVPL